MQVQPSTWAVLSGLKELVNFDASFSNVTDASLRSLGPMPKLRWLNLDSTAVGSRSADTSHSKFRLGGDTFDGMRSLKTLILADSRCASALCSHVVCALSTE